MAFFIKLIQKLSQHKSHKILREYAKTNSQTNNMKDNHKRPMLPILLEYNGLLLPITKNIENQNKRIKNFLKIIRIFLLTFITEHIEAYQ